MPIINRVADLSDEIAAWRRDFHENPEILYEVHRTAGIVADKLKAFGCDEVVTGLGQTGVVGVIKGRTNTSGKVIGLRADMDALPIHEASDLPYKSCADGKMHACGHDGHTAMLLGAAKYLAETRNFDGTAIMIFQPAEEGGAGAAAMVKDGLMDRFGVQEIYGMHNLPGLPVGHFAIRPGAIMAAADRLNITINGRGAHAGRPHEGVDTIVVASHVVLALQSIASRNVDPLESVVVSMCIIKAGDAGNVLPQTAELVGTIRTLSPAVQDLTEARVVAIVNNVCAAFGATADVNYKRGYPVTANDKAKMDFIAEVAKAVAGADAVDMEVPPMMGSEDFSFMLNERPGAYIFCGNGDTAGLHHPSYNFDDAAAPYGVSLWAKIVEEGMPAR